MSKSDLRKTAEKSKITKDTGKAFGFLALIPFGWIIVACKMVARKNDVIAGIISKKVGLAVIKNYTIGLWWILGLICFANISSSSPTLIPNSVPGIILICVYVNQTNKKRFKKSSNIDLYD
ncbi:MAG: hypothetical protein LBM09_03295 [Candidatus Nomurabacteria bacterium]|jgi:hypothetical protein|nr:hypothetical protein [Candidatus Nomurabacteria bacterium]